MTNLAKFHWPLTLQFDLLPLMCFEIIVLFIPDLFTKFNRYWPCLAKVMGENENFRFFSLWPLTSNLTFDRYCHTIIYLFSFWRFLPSFIDNWHFRQKLWMKGYYFEHLSIDLWPYTLTFDPHNESDLFVFTCLTFLSNFITIVHFMLKFCMKMYIFRKIAVTFDLYIWPFTLVDI